MRRWCYVSCGVLAACSPVEPGGVKGEVHVTQTNSEIVANGLSCASTSTMPSQIAENSFYRAFTLTDHDIRGAFHVKKVSFGVFRATAGGGAPSQPGDISIYAYDGDAGGETIDLAKLTKLGQTKGFNIPNAAMPTTFGLDMDIDVPAGTETVVVELHVRDGRAAMHHLLIGFNGQGERSPAYQRAPTCMFPNPVTVEAAGFPNRALVLSMLGDAL